MNASKNNTQLTCEHLQDMAELAFKLALDPEWNYLYRNTSLIFVRNIERYRIKCQILKQQREVAYVEMTDADCDWNSNEDDRRHTSEPSSPRQEAQRAWCIAALRELQEAEF